MGQYGLEWGSESMFRKKKANEETKVVMYSIFLVLWPGKFPRTSCFLMSDKKVVWMGAGGYKWVCMGVVGCRGTWTKVRA